MGLDLGSPKTPRISREWGVRLKHRERRHWLEELYIKFAELEERAWGLEYARAILKLMLDPSRSPAVECRFNIDPTDNTQSVASNLENDLAIMLLDGQVAPPATAKAVKIPARAPGAPLTPLATPLQSFNSPPPR